MSPAPLYRGLRHMRSLPSVVRASWAGDYGLRLVFNDGSENTVDDCESRPLPAPRRTIHNALLDRRFKP